MVLLILYLAYSFCLGYAYILDARDFYKTVSDECYKLKEPKLITLPKLIFCPCYFIILILSDTIEEK